MKVTVAICDRCDRRLDGDTHCVVQVKRGDTVKTFDLCPEHELELVRSIKGASAKAKRPEPSLAEALLEGVKRTANGALERYAEGANADELAQALRDVSSGARRPVTT
jgi:hypothetical protein